MRELTYPPLLLQFNIITYVNRVIVNFALTQDSGTITRLAKSSSMDTRQVWLLAYSAFSSPAESIAISIFTAPVTTSSAANTVRSNFLKTWKNDTTEYDPVKYGVYNKKTGSPLFDANTNHFFDTSYAPGAAGDGSPDRKYGAIIASRNKKVEHPTFVWLNAARCCPIQTIECLLFN